jgi:PAS domain S-box-containing protein
MTFEPDFKRFFRHTPALVAVANYEGYFVWVNESWERVLGRSAESMGSEPYENFVHPDDVAATSKVLSSKAAAGEEVINTINRYRHVDGSWVYLEWNINIDPHNQLLYGIANDVTTIVLRNELLKATQERFELAVDGSHDGIWDWDIENNDGFLSDRCLEILGHKEEFNMGAFLIWEKALHPDDKDRVLHALFAHLKDRTDYEVEFRMMCPDSGQWRWFLTRGQAIWNDEGRATRMAGSLSDINDRKQHEQQLRDARRLAEEASKAKSMFLANMSHELRTPLNSIIGFSRRILSKGDTMDPARFVDGVDAIFRNGNYLLELVNALLDLAKIEAGMMVLKKQSASFKGLVEDVSSQFKPLSEEKGLTLNFTQNLTQTNYYFDFIKVKQILINLISNAIKFTEKGYVDVTISEDFSVGQLIKIEVLDTGVGLEEDEFNQIFNKFYQVKSSAYPGQGTGIGLALVREFSRLHGGEVSVSSEKGTGTLFTVTIDAHHDLS